MNDEVTVAAGQQQSSANLTKASLIALVVAAVVLVAAVLPAEYGIDPTGIGRSLGLTQMGEAKSGAPIDTSADKIEQLSDGSTQVQIVIPPYSGREVKADLKAGEELTYEWSTGGVAVEFDMHGHTVDVSQEKSFAKGLAAVGKGTMKAPYDGVFGGYWENKSMAPVTLTVTAKGPFKAFAPINEGLVSTFKPSANTSDAPHLVELPMRPYMQRVFQTAAENVWAWQGYITDENGMRSLYPKNEEEWQKAENASLLLADMTNNLLIPGRRIDEPEWDKAVLQVRGVALKAAAAAGEKNQDKFTAATSELFDACQACHVRYDPTMQGQEAK